MLEENMLLKIYACSSFVKQCGGLKLQKQKNTTNLLEKTPTDKERTRGRNHIGSKVETPAQVGPEHQDTANFDKRGGEQDVEQKGKCRQVHHGTSDWVLVIEVGSSRAYVISNGQINDQDQADDKENDHATDEQD